MKKALFSLIMAFITVPAFAVEFENGDFKANIYGEIYGDAFYFNNHSSDTVTNTFGSQAFVGSSLLGVELSYGNVTGTFEAGLGDPVRRFFMTYRFGGSENHYIVIGRDTTIAAYSFGMVSNDFQALNDLGTLADNRRLQIRYGINGFELAVIMPSLGGGWNSDNTDDTGYKLSAVDANTDNALYTPFNVLPRVELGYTYTNDSLEFKVFGAYGAYMYSDNNKIASDKVFHSYNIGFGGQANFGNSFLQFTGWYGMNLDLMDSLANYKSRVVSIDSNTHKLSMFLEDGITKAENIQSAGMAVGLGHTFNDMFTPQIGVGYTVNFGDGYVQMDDALGTYLNCTIQITDWFSITPEVAYIDYMQDSNGNKEGYEIRAGALAAVVF